MKLRRWPAIAALFLLAVTTVSAVTVPSIRWRAQLIIMHLQGDIHDLSLAELMSMSMPGSRYYLAQLVDSGNPYITIRNPHQGTADVDAGSALYREHCSNCHGGNAEGGVGPSLAVSELRRSDSDWGLFRIITRGIEGTAMSRQALSDREAWQTIAYIRSLQSAKGGQEPADSRPPVRPVTQARLLSGRDASADWLTYSGDFDGKRYSRHAQINRGNAGQLQLLWMRQTDAGDDYLETSPIVNDGVMYFTVSPGTVLALDAASGEPIWSFSRPVPSRLSLCCGTVNRGVAVFGSTVFWGTIDAHLVALDANTGKELWQVEVADHEEGYTITSAPLAVDDLVLIGVSGGEYGIRGHLDAYRADTGERVWRFYTIPGPGEPGHETWSGDSWKHGGAGAWLSGSYDPELDLIYWGTGNPGPLYYGDDRLGDNLYANSVVALDKSTGTLEWYFQFTPHDLHDWAANQIPVLVDREWNGEPRRLLLTANRNGFFYALDRTTGEFLLAEAFVKQNWAERIDESGRPVLRPEAIPTTEGTVTWPSPHGGTNWQSPAYSPRTGLFYVAAVDGGRIVYKAGNTPEYNQGEFYLGSMHQLMSGDSSFLASLKAIDPQTGKIVWQYDNPRRNFLWRTGGVLTTAGDIVFGGDYTSLYALDAATGEELWRTNVGGYINAAPMTYEIDGRQQITVAAGRAILTFGIRGAASGSESTEVASLPSVSNGD